MQDPSQQSDNWTGEPQDEQADHPAGDIRIYRAHTFGLRAAALAGLVAIAAGADVVVSPLATIDTGQSVCCVSNP